uniref:Uncharacterized protein n=1 Tax=Arundo donax TaxID=35708 RepID=A0A0A8Y332_ARUDO
MMESLQSRQFLALHQSCGWTLLRLKTSVQELSPCSRSLDYPGFARAAAEHSAGRARRCSSVSLTRGTPWRGSFPP